MPNTDTEPVEVEDSPREDTVGGGAAEPAVLLLDLRDPLARSVSGALIGAEPTRRAIDHFARLGLAPMVRVPMTAGEVAERLGPCTPALAAELATTLPGGGFRVILLSGGRIHHAGGPIPLSR